MRADSDVFATVRTYVRMCSFDPEIENDIVIKLETKAIKRKKHAESPSYAPDRQTNLARPPCPQCRVLCSRYSA